MTVKQSTAALSQPALVGLDGPLDATHSAKVRELRALVDKSITLSPLLKRQLAAYPVPLLQRFLIARKWDVPAARDMMALASKWRIETGLDTQPLFPSPIPVRGYDMDDLIALRGCGTRPTNQWLDEAYAQLHAVGACAWHKYDKDGRPVYIERTGHYKTHELVDRAKALAPPGSDPARMMVDLHVHSNEIGGVLVDAMNKRHEQTGAVPVHSVTAIMDCAGLTMATLYGPAIDLLKAQSAHDQAHYAEGLHRVYVVNCPTMITFVWGIVRHWMDARVQQKVHFFSPEETPTRLQEFIDPENLPEFLGGKCNCAGGCCPDVGEGSAAVGKGATQTLTVAAGKVIAASLHVTAGERVKYQVVPDQDVNFSVVLHPATAVAKGDKTHDQHLMPKTKIATNAMQEGTLTAAVGGVVKFCFDNSHSWIKSKTITFRAEKLSIDHSE
jgi:hypothetical protein